MAIKLNIKNKDFIELDENIKKYFKDIFKDSDDSFLYSDGESFYLMKVVSYLFCSIMEQAKL